MAQDPPRIAALETQVHALAAALRLPHEDPTNVISSEVIGLARRGQSEDAVREVRWGTHLTLVQAKRLVSELAARAPKG